jgi:hypothetical protein
MGAKSLSQRLKYLPVEHDAKVRHRHMLTIHRVGIKNDRRSALDAVKNKLMAQKIKINPVIGLAAPGALQHPLIKREGFIEIPDRNCQVERA